MASFVSPTIVNVGYRSTNFWVVSAGRNRLLVDLGLTGMACDMFANLDRMCVTLDELRRAHEGFFPALMGADAAFA